MFYEQKARVADQAARNLENARNFVLEGGEEVLANLTRFSIEGASWTNGGLPLVNAMRAVMATDGTLGRLVQSALEVLEMQARDARRELLAAMATDPVGKELNATGEGPDTGARQTTAQGGIRDQGKSGATRQSQRA